MGYISSNCRLPLSNICKYLIICLNIKVFYNSIILSSKEVKIEFHNIASWISKDSQYNTDGSGLFYFSKSPNEVELHKWINFDFVLSSIITQDADILSFSEVFGVRQRDQLKKVLEERGYIVYFTDAFEMWSQAIPWEHLYNITGIMEDKLGSPNVHDYPLTNRRRIEGVLVSLKYLLSDSLWEWERNKTAQAKHLYNRLAHWILDGAISIFEFEDFTIAAWHVHNFDKKVLDILEWNIKENPFILVGDMNVPHADTILTQAPFNTIDWNSLLNPRWRTFMGSFSNPFVFGVSHIQPDVMIAKWIQEFQSELIPKSFWDHTAIWATLRISIKK